MTLLSGRTAQPLLFWGTMMNPSFPPFQVTAPARKELPGGLKVLLMLKMLGCLAVIGLAFVMFLELSDVKMGTDIARPLVLGLTLVSAAAMLEILGIVGVWGFKRWGVYIVTCFTMLGFVFDLKAGLTTGAIITLLTTLLAAMPIIIRWNDFD
jgi:hypothetical protein